MEFLNNSHHDRTEQIEIIAGAVESAFWALLTFILSFGSTLIEKYQKIDIPDILEVIIVIFIYAGLFLSARFKLYYKFWWWDDLLHTLSGIIMGFIGFIVIYKINYRYSMDISPVLVALFSFTFAITLGVFWEILEFSCDIITGSANQKWDLNDTETLMGKPYQGSGLRDTMSDLILDSIGAFVTSLITYYMYKNEKKKTLEEMKKMIKP
ncbi:MAG: hypothetical protein LBI94_07975 [Treponema sp.]|jgi:hypothetical protein|nr:hypothetical protein [Treponema sp.]